MAVPFLRKSVPYLIRGLESDSISKTGVWVLSPNPKGARKLLLVLHSFIVTRKRKAEDTGQVAPSIDDRVCTTLSITVEWKATAVKKRSESG